MTGWAIMFVVAALLGAAGIAMLMRLRAATVTERQIYAYRMVGIMLTAAACLLIAYATALRSWSVAP